MKIPSWFLESLGSRVALVAKVDDIPRGRVGILVSIQSGHEPGSSGPYATVCFSLSDWSDEHNVPLHALRPINSIG